MCAARSWPRRSWFLACAGRAATGDKGGSRTGAAPDRGGVTSFPGSTAPGPPRQVSFIVRQCIHVEGTITMPTIRCHHCGQAVHHLDEMEGVLSCPACGEHLAEFPIRRGLEKNKESGSKIPNECPICDKCPQCGATEHKKVRPDSDVSFTWDRVCKNCGTRYTPPTPGWARAVFAVLGLGLSVLGLGLLYVGLFGDWSESRGESRRGVTFTWAGALIIPTGAACVGLALKRRKTSAEGEVGQKSN